MTNANGIYRRSFEESARKKNSSSWRDSIENKQTPRSLKRRNDDEWKSTERQ